MGYNQVSMADKKTDPVPPLVLVNRMSEEAVFPSGFILSTYVNFFFFFLTAMLVFVWD